jgi:UDP-N-acetylmuramoylalanine--D-glutamate ligase
MIFDIKNLGIFGLGKTGKSSYISLKKYLPNLKSIICFDDNENTIKDFISEFGENDVVELFDERWQRLSAILVSPGIKPSHKIYEIAKSYKISITSDIELFFLLNKYKNNDKSIFIAITGTNGKSTATSLTHHILKFCNIDYAIGGNIGVPIFELDLNKDGYIIELSSFQLELLNKFKPKITSLLNITPDHLDHHLNFEQYIDAKKKIYNNLDQSSSCIINIDNNITNEIFQEQKHKNIFNIIPISTKSKIENGVSIINEFLFDNYFDNKNYKIQNNIHLQGSHNAENILTAYVTAKILSIETNLILESISHFKGLPHRMEYLNKIENIYFYNDSKATNSHAASMSIASLENILLLAGGISKADSIKPLTIYANKIKKIYLYGRDKFIMAKDIENIIEYEIFDNLENAFETAYKDARIYENDVNILLAPACSSLDQFKNFEERGDLFKKLVNNIIKYDK